MSGIYTQWRATVWILTFFIWCLLCCRISSKCLITTHLILTITYCDCIIVFPSLQMEKRRDQRGWVIYPISPSTKGGRVMLWTQETWLQDPGVGPLHYPSRNVDCEYIFPKKGQEGDSWKGTEGCSQPQAQASHTWCLMWTWSHRLLQLWEFGSVGCIPVVLWQLLVEHKTNHKTNRSYFD